MDMYSPMRRNTRKQKYTSTFDKKCLLRVQNDRRKNEKKKEEVGSKEENRPEGADVIRIHS